jgi:hypothetical protein
VLRERLRRRWRACRLEFRDQCLPTGFAFVSRRQFGRDINPLPSGVEGVHTGSARSLPANSLEREHIAVAVLIGHSVNLRPAAGRLRRACYWTPPARTPAAPSVSAVSPPARECADDDAACASDPCEIELDRHSVLTCLQRSLRRRHPGVRFRTRGRAVFTVAGDADEASRPRGRPDGACRARDSRKSSCVACPAVRSARRPLHARTRVVGDRRPCLSDHEAPPARVWPLAVQCVDAGRGCRRRRGSSPANRRVPPLEESRPCLLPDWIGEDSYAAEHRQLRHGGMFRAVQLSDAPRKYCRAHAASVR